MDNSGSIIVGNTTAIGGSGIVHRNGGAFNNKPGGYIQIDRVLGQQAFYSIGLVNNEGAIEIGSNAAVSGEGIRMAGNTFNNKSGGSIQIDQTGNQAMLVQAGALLSINAMGSLTINGAGVHGLDNYGAVDNSGAIVVGNTTAINELGIIHRNGGTFNNKPGGVIQIDRTLGAQAFYSSGLVNNEGVIEIGSNAAVSAVGIILVGNTFNNNSGGYISIKQTTVYSLQNDVNSTFNNNACATLSIFDNLNNSGAFTNAGLFTVNTTQTHTNSALTNNGIIAYPQGNPIPNVANNEIIIAPTTANACDVISPAFSLGSPVDFTIQGIFTDEAATMSAGTYTTATNTFTPTAFLAQGVHPFYVKITDGIGGCTRILPWQLTTQNCCPTITAPTLTQPTCVTPTGTIVVNATGSGALEYSINNGSTWQSTNTFGGQAPGSYHIKVRLQANPSCETTYGSNPVVLSSPFTASTTADTWTGCVSTDWATPGNWADGSVPTVNDDVTIPNVANDPVIMGSTAALARSVLVQAGGVLTLNTMGSLTINNSAVHGLENYGTVDNSGTIIVGNTTAIGGVGIVHRNGGAFNNKPGGYIQIDWVLGGQAFYSNGLVNNEGVIEIGSNAAVSGEGIRLEGNTFNNKPGGSIQIDQTGSHAIRLINSGIILNNEALIEIGSQSDVSGNGIRNGSGCTFNNRAGGDIRINRIGIYDTNGIPCLINFGTFTNDANITVGNGVLLYGQDGIQNQGNFSNTATGVISIEKPWGNGIWNFSGTFQNAGKITISNIFYFEDGEFSTGMLSTAPFSNHAGAEIHIDQVANGIVSTNAFTNAGLIRMGENAPLVGSGIANIQGANAVFNNNAGGDISIKQTAVDGVQNDVNSTFNNNACATLTVFDNLNNSGAFTNAGLFTVNTTQTHTNSALTNNGIIAYPQGNPIPNVTNNEIIIAPTTANDCDVISPAFGLGSPVDFTVEGIFSDEAATMSAGTYVTATNTFTPTTILAEGVRTFYVKIMDGSGGCTRIVPWQLTTEDCCDAPQAICKTATIALVGNSASLSVADVNNGSTADCGCKA